MADKRQADVKELEATKVNFVAASQMRLSQKLRLNNHTVYK